MERVKKIVDILCISLIVLFLSVGFSNASVFAAEGEDDLSDYIEVKTPKDLYKIRSNMEGKYKLMNDIDLTEATAPGGIYDYNGCGWNPIGSNNSYSNIPFTGVFDGQGNSIIGMQIKVNNTSSTGDRYVGLFSNNSGCIKNLNMKNCSISFSSDNHDRIYCGMVSGYNYGLIEQIKVIEGSIYLKSFYNGLCGTHDETISVRAAGIAGVTLSNGIVRRCYNSSNIHTDTRGSYYSSDYKAIVDSHVSGITNGNTNTEIDECMNSGELSYNHFSSPPAGGVNCRSYRSGISYYGIVSNSFSTCSSAEYGISFDKVTNCYYTGDAKSLPSVTTQCYYYVGKGKSGSGWIGLNDAQMQDPDFFEGFDFDNVWRMSDETVYKYPQLQSIRNGVTKVEIISEPSNEIVVGTTLKYDDAVARIYREDGSTEDVVLTPENTTGGSTSTTGAKTVTYTYKGASASFVINVVPVRVKELEVTSLPNKVDYIEGQTFDPTGLKVYAIYNNGNRTVCNDYALSDVDTTVGEKTVIVSYNSVETSFKVNYIEKIITNLAVTTPPTKTVYDEGEAFDPTGMVVKATYNDGEIKEVTDYTIGDISGYGSVNVEISYEGLKTYTPITIQKLVKAISFDRDSIEVYEGNSDVLSVIYDPDDAYNKEIEWSSADETIAVVDENGEVTGVNEGTTEITAAIKGYNDIFAVCSVKVNDSFITDIEITKMPTKLNYKEGELFDPSGMIIKHVYNSGMKEPCTDYTVGNIQGTGDVKVKISCGEFEKYIDITVIYLTDIEIESMPKKLTYMEGETFDSSGLVVNKIYSNGEKERCNDYEISELTETGDVKVTISYAGFIKEIDVHVDTIESKTWLTKKELAEIEKLKEITKNGKVKNGLIEFDYKNYTVFMNYKVRLNGMIFTETYSYNILDNPILSCTYRYDWDDSRVDYSIFKANTDITSLEINKIKSSVVYQYYSGAGLFDSMFRNDAAEKAEYAYACAESMQTTLSIIQYELKMYLDIDMSKIGFRKIPSIYKPSSTPTPSIKPTSTPTSTPTPQDIPTQEPTGSPLDKFLTIIPTVAPTATPKTAPTPQKDDNYNVYISGVGKISKDGCYLKDLDSIVYMFTHKMNKKHIVNNLLIAENESQGKYRITKVNKKNGIVTGGTVEYVGTYSIYEKEIIIPDKVIIDGLDFNVNSISNNLFANNKRITSVVIGKNVTKIGKKAFYGCSKLKKVTIKTKKLKKIGSNAFKGIYKKPKFKVPKKKLKKYKKMIKKAKAPKKSKITK